ncbi:MAG: NPCBM/NEW2 domain-containing protein, partial [Clostridium sp.]
KAFDSGIMTGNTGAKDINLSLVGVKELKLSVRDGGDGINFDHADWGNAVLLSSPGNACDINGDGFVDVADLAMVAAIYNCKASDVSFKKECDLNRDGIIDLYDLVKVSSNIK